MCNLSGVVALASYAILATCARRIPTASSTRWRRNSPFLLLSMRGGENSDSDNSYNRNVWLNHAWGNEQSPSTSDEIDVQQQNDEQPPPPPSEDLPQHWQAQQKPQQQQEKQQKQQQQGDLNEQRNINEFTTTPFQQDDPPPPPFFYAPPKTPRMTSSSSTERPEQYYHYNNEDSRTSEAEGPHAFPYPNANPFFNQQNLVQQQQQDMFISDLYDTISSLHHQLQISEETLHNISSSYYRYEYLSRDLQGKLEECQEELRQVTTKSSQQELHVLELQDKCETLQQLQISSQLMFQKLQEDYSDKQQSLDNVTDTLNLLKETHETALDEMNILATAIEKHRIRLVAIETAEQEEGELERLRLLAQQKKPIKSKKELLYNEGDDKVTPSFWMKFLSFFFASNQKDNEEEQQVIQLDDDEDDDEDGSYEEAQNLAQSSLLFALTQSREYVSELETLVDAYEQNCTFNEEQLISKQELIDELHDRMSVFEEDKFVLKAALQQLRKEMQAEENERIDLENELKRKDQEIGALEETMRQLESDYSAHISDLEKKTQQINKTLTDHLRTSEEIEVYVDRMEQRLVTLTRARDMALLEVEEAAVNATAITIEQHLELSKQMKSMEEDIMSMQQEHVHDIAMYNAQLSATKENMERALSDKNMMECQLQDMTNQRDRLQNVTLQLQLQMNDLRLNLQAVASQLEFLEQQAASDKEEQERVQEVAAALELEAAQIRLEAAAVEEQQKRVQDAAVAVELEEAQQRSEAVAAAELEEAMPVGQEELYDEKDEYQEEDVLSLDEERLDEEIEETQRPLPLLPETSMFLDMIAAGTSTNNTQLPSSSKSEEIFAEVFEEQMLQSAPEEMEEAILGVEEDQYSSDDSEEEGKAQEDMPSADVEKSLDEDIEETHPPLPPSMVSRAVTGTNGVTLHLSKNEDAHDEVSSSKSEEISAEIFEEQMLQSAPEEMEEAILGVEEDQYSSDDSEEEEKTQEDMLSADEEESLDEDIEETQPSLPLSMFSRAVTGTSGVTLHLSKNEDALDEVLPSDRKLVRDEGITVFAAEDVLQPNTEVDQKQSSFSEDAVDRINRGVDITNSLARKEAGNVHVLPNRKSIVGSAQKKRPFRQIRKKLAHVTGMHGFFSGSYFSIKERARSRPSNFTLSKLPLLAPKKAKAPLDQHQQL